MTLSKEETDTLLEHINDKWEVPNCRYCGENEWSASGKIFLRLSKEGELDLTGESQPTAPLVCMNCGNTVLINLVVAGVFDGSEAPDDE